MAEFQEFMKQFNRMCWSYRRECKCPMACPMNGVNISQCRKIAFERPKETEKIVMSWAAEHPVVYPTWEEWLVANGIMEPDDVRLNGCCRFYYNGKPVYNIPSPKMFDPIPADLAEKLGIEPNEGV